MKTREAAVSGQFYPENPNSLKKQVENLFSSSDETKIKSREIIVPHAGYIYSGKIAALGFKALEKNKTYVILSPNHTGLGAAISISDADAWETPLGKVNVNKKISKVLSEKMGSIDGLAHAGEHSIEVQLPFLQSAFDDFEIVAVTIGAHDFKTLKKLGNALYELSEVHNFGVIASSDFSHFLPEETAKKLDFEAIKKIEKLEVEGFYNLVIEKGMSICGFGAITALMEYLKKKGKAEGKLLGYDTSASASKDKSSVVGYAAIAFI